MICVFLFVNLSLLLFYFINLLRKNETSTTVEKEIISDKRKTHTEPVHADMMAVLALNGNATLRAMHRRSFSTNGIACHVSNNGLRPNRLIKLNRANESRANPAWGMHACVPPVRATANEQLHARPLHPSEIMPGNYGNISCNETAGIMVLRI